MAFSYYRALTIDYTKCGSADSSSFPVLVSISDVTFKTIANGGNVSNSSGYDIAFFSDSALTTKIPWEVEFYDGTNGILIAWVNIATVSCTVDTVFYVGYGDSGISTAQNTGSNGPTYVWDANYVGVWHLGDGTTPNFNDSTGINNGTNNNTTATTGKIDGGIALSGATQYVTIGNNASLQIVGAITIEAWINPTDRSNFNGIVSKTSGGNPSPYDYYLSASSGIPNFFRGNGSISANSSGTSAVPSGSWSHIAVTDVGGSGTNLVTHYLNGSINGSGSITVAIVSDSGTDAKIGTRNDNVTLFKGSMDEIRISNITRSADWIITEYNNQNAPGNIGSDNFIKFGTETSTSTSSDFTFSPTDTLSLSDAISALNFYNLLLSDTNTLSDANLQNIRFLIPIIDSNIPSDNVGINLGATVTPSDTISLSDAISIPQSSNFLLSDTFSISDSISILQTLNFSLSDTLNLNDTLGLFLTYSLALSDSETISDTLGLSLTYSLNLSDNISLSDILNYIIGTIGLPNVQYLLSDSLVLSDVQLNSSPNQNILAAILFNTGTPIWTDQQLALWASDALADIAVNVPCIFARECIVITMGRSVYTLPNYVRTLRRVTWRGKSLEPASWEELQLLTPATVFLGPESTANVETSQSRPLFYAMHPTNPYDIRLHPCPNESFTISGEPDPYSPIPNSPSCIIDYWREPDITGTNPLISLPPYISRRTQKAYVLSVAFAAEGKGQDGDASNYYDKKYQFLLDQFKMINEGCFISKKYSLGDGMLDPQNYRYPRPFLPPNFERTIF